MLIVVKAGGKVLRERLSELATDIKNLSTDQVVLVHGGGIEVTEIASKLVKKQEFIVSPDGFRSRYTDRDTIEVYTMVIAGKINKHLVSSLLKQGIPSVGLSGIDGLLVRAERKKRLITVDGRGRKKVIDGGYTGKISKVDPQLLWLLLKSGYVPVIAPIAVGEEFEKLNVDGDRMAAYIAGALKADKLILLTDVPGIMLDGKLLSKTSISELKEILPKLGHGMITKVYATIEALEFGVGEVMIASGFEKLPVSSALGHESCTVISRG
jgi:acetylglutamate/LysW-gamma-L-alpha-aminoadipate kinase